MVTTSDRMVQKISHIVSWFGLFLRSLIATAQSIDPTYCDVHQQYAHVYFQQAKFIEFEEETVNALFCKFTMGQAMNNWNRYWEVVLRNPNDIEVKDRYDKYMKRIKDAVARAEKNEEAGQGGRNNKMQKFRSRGSSTMSRRAVDEL